MKGKYKLFIETQEEYSFYEKPRKIEIDENNSFSATA